ncbi:NEW3 domain-containing protein [Marinobacterium maritimum]|uniref:NEW3 domain-containing protein n=1 Tax=Marinobacterium maritimum TaxID=500162 RepID=A0ABN1I637_9GAMM
MSLAPRTFARSLITAGITAALGFTTLPALAAADHAHQHGNAAVTAPNAKAAEARQKAFDHTQALMALQKQWAKSKGADKSRALEQLVAKAEERRTFLLELMESNPAAVLGAAIPEEKQIGMPAEVLEKLEQKLELEGELESTYLDNFEKPEMSRLKHELKTPFGERFELHFAGKAPSFPFGSEISAYGLLIPKGNVPAINGSVVVGGENDDEYPVAYAGADGSVNNTLSSIANDSLGEVKTLVMLVNFQDRKEEPYTRAFAQDLVFNQVSDYYKENSYGQSWLAGDVTSWMTMPISSTDSSVCYGTYLWDAADAVAQKAGYDISTYDRLVYVFPAVNCGFSGAAQVGGTRTSINGSLKLKTTAHELGHNFGLTHAHSLYCSDGSSIGSGSPSTAWGNEKWTNCNQAEYGNTVDVMGDSPSAHFNAGKKEVLGWLEYGSSPDITEITSSGRYEIDVMSSQSSSSRPKALKVLKSTNPDTGISTWYYIEFRQPIGYDSILGKSYTSSLVYPENVTNGVVIHAVYGSGTDWLLDMTPDTTMLYPRDPALVVGETFNGPDGGFSITTVSTDSTKAVVDISLDGEAPTVPTCTRTNPSIAFSPAQSNWVTSGTTVNYGVTVTNNDSTGCSSSSFNLSKSGPSGWNLSLANSSLSAAPGESVSTTLSVTSAAGSSNGFYTINAAAANGTYSTSGSVTYVVDNPEAVNTAPVATNDTASTTENTAVTIDVLSNDSDADGDSLSISSISGVNGSATITSTGAIRFTPANGFTGTETFNYSVSDGKGGSDTATVSVNVTAASTNSAPVALDDNATSDGSSSVTITVLGNDYDPDGDRIQITSVSQPAKGAVRINADGTLTFTPAKNFRKGDSFGYRISDGNLSATATVIITEAPQDSSNGSGGNKGKGPNK